MYHNAVPRQRLGKHITEATNTQSKIEKLLDALLLMRLMLYEEK
jgi:hypothetical protein